MSEYGRAMPDLYMHACLTCVFVGPCPIRRAIIIYYTLDMLSRIHKHFGSVGVERTCCVADWQKNIGIREYANLLSYEGDEDSDEGDEDHEGDEDSDEGPEINDSARASHTTITTSTKHPPDDT